MTVQVSSPARRPVTGTLKELDHVLVTLDDPRPLNTNHGGFCLFLKGNMHVRPITSHDPRPIYDAFECLHSRFRYTLIGHCLIPSRLSHQHWSIIWIIQRTASYTSVIIAGDTNIHLDYLVGHHTHTPLWWSSRCTHHSLRCDDNTRQSTSINQCPTT